MSMKNTKCGVVITVIKNLQINKNVHFMSVNAVLESHKNNHFQDQIVCVVSDAVEMVIMRRLVMLLHMPMDIIWIDNNKIILLLY